MSLDQRLVGAANDRPNVPEGEHILDTLIPGYSLPAVSRAVERSCFFG